MIPERRRLSGTRLERAKDFGPDVLKEFNQACAICKIQLKVVEGAHIIPVHDERGLDEKWNGLGLCRNHHRLFDMHVLRINRDGLIRVEDDDITYLRDLNVISGYESVIQPFIGQTIALPNYYPSNRPLREKFQNALSIIDSL
jgi:putative restriction endonuclease